MKKLKNVFWLAAIAASAVVVGCEKDDEGDSSSFNDVIKATNVVNAPSNAQVDAVKIYLQGDGLELFEAGSGKYENGSFTIRLVETVPAQYLSPLFEEGKGGVPEGVTVSNADAKWTGDDEIWAYKGKDLTGRFQYRYGDENGDYIEAKFYYSDRDVNITGTVDYYYSTRTYSLFLKKGWNIMFYISKGTIDQRTSVEPSGLKWYYEGE